MFYSQHIDLHKQEINQQRKKTPYFCMNMLLNRRTGRNRLVNILLIMSIMFYSDMRQWIDSPIHLIREIPQYN